MKIVNKLHQRVYRLEKTIYDFEEILGNDEVKNQLDMIEYVRQKLNGLKEKRDEYLICIQAITYLEEHLEKDEFQKVVTIRKDTID